MSTGPRRRNSALFRTLVAASLLYLIALPVAVLVALMSPMAAADGGAGIFGGAALSFPAALLICSAAAWTAYARGWNAVAWAAAILPLVWLPLLLFALYSGI